MKNIEFLEAKLAPQIVIPAGSLSSNLQINALEEYPSDNEDDETIVLSPSAINANLSTSDPTTITIKNNGLLFTKKESFSKSFKGAVSWGISIEMVIKI